MSGDLIDPEDGIRDSAEAVRIRLIERLAGPEWDALVDLAVTRAQSIGAAEYGNAAYEMDDFQLSYEGAQEIADLIFYEHVRVVG